MTIRAAAVVCCAVLRCAVVLCVVLVLSACAPTPPAEPDATALPAGVAVELRQSRADVAARQAMLSVTNDTEHPLDVADVSIADPRFSAPARRVVERTSRVAPGAVVDIRVQLATVSCTVADAGEATATIRFAHDGIAGVATVAAPDRVRFVADLHARECVQQEALRSASIDLAEFAPSPAGEPAVLRLVVTPRDGVGSLRIVGIRETNLLTFRDVEGGMRRLDVDQTGTGRTVQTVDLPLVPLRCDPHAVQEDKRGTVFRLFVETGGTPGSFDIAASASMRGEILAWITTWCPSP